MTDDKNAAAPIDWTAPEMQYLEAEDYKLPPADPVLLASANRMLSDRLERVAHVLRGCGLPALAEISGAEDLQMAAAALSGAYQMALAELAAAKHGDNELLEQARVVVDLRAQIASLTADVMRTRGSLNSAINEADRLRAELAVERQACKTLQERSSTAPVRAATSFIVRAAKRKPRTFSSIEKAREAAMAAIRAGAQRAEVCPMLPPVGVARKGAEWRAA